MLFQGFGKPVKKRMDVLSNPLAENRIGRAHAIASQSLCIRLARQFQNEVHRRKIRQLLTKIFPDDAFHQIAHDSPACQTLRDNQSQTGRRQFVTGDRVVQRVVKTPVQIEELTSDYPAVLKYR